MKTITHGTTSTYVYYKCRCDECKAARSDSSRRWRLANADKKREDARRWYEANSEQKREDVRLWREANPDKCREYFHRRHATRRAEAIALLGGVCVVCGTTERLEFDHIDPSEKRFVITSRLNSSWDKLMPELMKCQLLCNPCHKAKTYKKET